MPEGLTDEAKAEIQAAAALVRKDFSKETIHSVLSEYNIEKRTPEPELDDDGKPKPPPKKDPEDPPPVPRKRGLWWNAEDEEESKP